jgi:hypothetical protein
MATIIKYDATGLDGFLADCDRYIETYYGFSNPEEAASYLKDEMTSHEEVLKEYKKLTEFITYRQSLADKAKEEKNFEKLKSLCNGKTVGLIRLREAAKTFDAVLSIYTEAEDSEQKASSAKLLTMIKAPSPVKGFSAPPAAGCGAPTAAEAEEEQSIIEKSMTDNSPKVKELIEIDEHATEFEDRPDVAVHEFARDDMEERTNLRIAEIVDQLTKHIMETARLNAELLRLQNKV